MRKPTIAALILAVCLAWSCDNGAQDEDADPIATSDSIPADVPPPAPMPNAAPDDAVGRVDAIKGKGEIKRGSLRLGIVADENLFEGDVVETSDASLVRVILTDNTILSMGPKTSITIADMKVTDESRNVGLKLLVGQFWAKIEKWTGGGESKWEVELPTAVAGIRGTTLWGSVEDDTVCSIEGNVEVVSTKTKPKKKRKARVKPKRLKSMQCVTDMGKGKTRLLKKTKKRWKKVKAAMDSITIE